jgi:hypothetical protein
VDRLDVAGSVARRANSAASIEMGALVVVTTRRSGRMICGPWIWTPAPASRRPQVRTKFLR